MLWAVKSTLVVERRSAETFARQAASDSTIGSMNPG
jgi:hypothetical protein